MVIRNDKSTLCLKDYIPMGRSKANPRKLTAESPIYVDENEDFSMHDDAINEAKLTTKQEPPDDQVDTGFSHLDPIERLQVHVVHDHSSSSLDEEEGGVNKTDTPSPVPSEPEKQQQTNVVSNVHLTKPIILPSFTKSLISPNSLLSHQQADLTVSTFQSPTPTKKFRRLYSNDANAKHSPNHIMSWMRRRFTLRRGSRMSATEVVQLYEKEHQIIDSIYDNNIKNYQVSNHLAGLLLRKIFPEITRCKITVNRKRVWVYKDLGVIDGSEATDRNDESSSAHQYNSSDTTRFYNLTVPPSNNLPTLEHPSLRNGLSGSPSMVNPDRKTPDSFVPTTTFKPAPSMKGDPFVQVSPNSSRPSITLKYNSTPTSNTQFQANIVKWLQDNYEYYEGSYVRSIDVLRKYNFVNQCGVKYLSHVGRIIKMVFPQAKHIRRSMKGCRREWVYQNIRAKADSKIPPTLDYNSNGNGDSSEVDRFFQGVYDKTLVDIKVEPTEDAIVTSPQPDRVGGSSSSGSPVIMKHVESSSPGSSSLQITNVISGGEDPPSYEGSSADENILMSPDVVGSNHHTTEEEEELMDDHSSHSSSNRSLVEEILHETSSSYHSESNSNQQNEGHHLHWEDIKEYPAYEYGWSLTPVLPEHRPSNYIEWVLFEGQLLRNQQRVIRELRVFNDWSVEIHALGKKIHVNRKYTLQRTHSCVVKLLRRLSEAKLCRGFVCSKLNEITIRGVVVTKPEVWASRDNSREELRQRSLRCTILYKGEGMACDKCCSVQQML